MNSSGNAYHSEIWTRNQSERENLDFNERERERAATDENDARINSAVQNTKSGSTDFTHSMGLK